MRLVLLAESVLYITKLKLLKLLTLLFLIAFLFKLKNNKVLVVTILFSLL